VAERMLARIAGDLDVAEAVECEARLVDLFALTLEDVVIRGPGGSQVGGVDRAVRVQGFGVAQGHFRSCLTLDLQTHPPDHVAAQIEDVTAGFGLGDGLRFQLFGDPDTLVRLGDEVGVPYLLYFHPVPCRVVESGLGPARHLFSGVV
jgi:hypothetical protein